MAGTGTSSATSSQKSGLQALRAAVQAAGDANRSVAGKSNASLAPEDVKKLVRVAQEHGISADEFVQTVSDSGLLSNDARKNLDTPELRNALDQFQAKEALRQEVRTFLSTAACELGLKHAFAAAIQPGSDFDTADVRSALNEAIARVQNSSQMSKTWDTAQALIAKAAAAADGKARGKLGIDLPMVPETRAADASTSVTAGAESSAQAAAAASAALGALREGGFAYAVAAIARYATRTAEDAAAADPSHLSALGEGLAKSSPVLTNALPLLENVTNLKSVGSAANELWKAAKTGTPAERLVTSFHFVGTVVGCVPGWQVVGTAARVAKHALWDSTHETSAP